VQLQNTSNLNTILYIVFSLFLSVIALCIGIYLGNKILN
jgi:fluoride ion exporter CrcB/FEX